jgi:nucleoid-associated protein YgaU
MDDKQKSLRDKRLAEDLPDQPQKRAPTPAQPQKQAPTPVPASAQPQVIKHVWTKDDTYADLAFKYYGSINEQYWRHIYNHNAHIIGAHPNDIKVGTEIEIPPLPDELKKK